MEGIFTQICRRWLACDHRICSLVSVSIHHNRYGYDDHHDHHSCWPCWSWSWSWSWSSSSSSSSMPLWISTFIGVIIIVTSYQIVWSLSEQLRHHPPHPPTAHLLEVPMNVIVAPHPTPIQRNRTVRSEPIWQSQVSHDSCKWVTVASEPMWQSQVRRLSAIWDIFLVENKLIQHVPACIGM